ncbi:hypothetical protein NIES2119_22175 [[Phormidium ambiguum] IAM M-71]|uniref:Uncharacterized protein n=1 Tax=[Phormidium ambiguum] IAM M-71 TaxID=454136 RepID=A0A1U7IB83_9CYAN|nr:hypothetical protein [Phormidium ambiguum]OKH33815.1 hypothetical protein NIES2119_22175 [Phormidium ambiguum IAM M-71]
MKGQVEVNRVDTLIITVGTRQVGWRSPDRIIRCFGADGDRGYPPHIDDLYRELNIERGCYEDTKHQPLWSVRDLGERYYQHCAEWLGDDFSAIELLLDEKIIADSVNKGLKHIVLIATNQPETVSWGYRRADTFWLAELMKKKITSVWKQVKVDVLALMVNANHREAIRQELESIILPISLESMQAEEPEEFVLLIENKGAVPAIAEGLEICAAALVRQCQVFNINPIEPQPSFLQEANGYFTARKAEEYELIPVSEYFWPLERLRVISAWERGDFQEAKLWLQAHQTRHKTLYQLAGYLALSTNWEIVKLINDQNFIRGWLRSKALSSLASEAQVNRWYEQTIKLQKNDFAQAWESVFLMELALQKENYTAAFMQFSQTLERLLYLRCLEEDWIGKGWIQMGSDPDPSFNNLIYAWLLLNQVSKSDNLWKLFTAIRKKRNRIIHKAEPVTLLDLRDMWTSNNFPVKIPFDAAQVSLLMGGILQQVCRSSWQIPETTLLRSLYQWGLEVLQSEVAFNQT